MYYFRATTQTLLALAWLASQKQCREEVVLYQETELSQPRLDGQKMITNLLEGALKPLEAATWDILSPALVRLVRHSYARIQMDSLEWALFGKNAVYFDPNALPSTPDHALEEFAAQSETGVLLTIVRSHDSLRHFLCGESPISVVNVSTEKGLGASKLRRCFEETAVTLLPLSPGSFLVPELLRLSFEQIDWEAVLTGMRKE